MRRSLSTLGARILVLSIVALTLVGLLRPAVFGVPLVSYLCVVCLPKVPGTVLVSHLFEGLPGPAVVPVSFATSVGIFALVGVPFLAMGLGLGPYLWAADAIVAASLVMATLGALRHKHPGFDGTRDPWASDWL